MKNAGPETSGRRVGGLYPYALCPCVLQGSAKSKNKEKKRADIVIADRLHQTLIRTCPLSIVTLYRFRGCLAGPRMTLPSRANCEP
jgi:hypothetical protein